MRTLKQLFLLAALTLSPTLFAQTHGEIKGKVFDRDTKQSLPLAHVYVESAGQEVGTISDMDGRYTIKPLNPGIYNVRVQYAGYDTIIVPGVRVNPDMITFVEDIFTGIRAIDMGPGVVVYGEAKNPLIDPEATGKMTITATHLKKNPRLRDPLGMVEAMIPGVTKSNRGDGLHFRGSRTSAIVYFIDGVKQSDTFSPVPSSAIGSITVYTGGLPAKYGDVTGGVIIIETKSYFDYYNEWVAMEEVRKLKEEVYQ